MLLGVQDTQNLVGRRLAYTLAYFTVRYFNSIDGLMQYQMDYLTCCYCCCLLLCGEYCGLWIRAPRSTLHFAVNFGHSRVSGVTFIQCFTHLPVGRCPAMSECKHSGSDARVRLRYPPGSFHFSLAEFFFFNLPKGTTSTTTRIHTLSSLTYSQSYQPKQ